MKTVDDVNFKGKRALVRVDFNVPQNDHLCVTDTSRIEAAKPTIMKILKDGGSVVLMAHLGRPKGKEKKFSLKNIVGAVSQVLNKTVRFVDDCIGENALKASEELKAGEILLLENLRFYKEEKAGDENFAKELSKLGDIYVNDAFGAAHRAHASTSVIAKYFDDKCFGKLLAGEIENIDRVLNSSKKPVTAILGGAKVSTKIGVIENILDKIDHLIIGGGMIFTFIKAQGGKIGDSLVEEDKQDLALNILKKAREHDVKVHLPKDVVVGGSFSEETNTKVVPSHKVPEGWMGLDIGPETCRDFHEVIVNSKTILWNGPAGVFELKPFEKGTIEMGKSIAEATKNGAFSLVGGGDSVAAVKKFGFKNAVSYVSTGGGAMLEMLEGKVLPGIEALS